eukprot:SAG22_NODE_7534_length_730_cov_2.063932_2_plen_79_part_01
MERGFVWDGDTFRGIEMKDDEAEPSQEIDHDDEIDELTGVEIGSSFYNGVPLKDVPFPKAPGSFYHTILYDTDVEPSAE